jgi:hypothetical protein
MVTSLEKEIAIHHPLKVIAALEQLITNEIPNKLKTKSRLS